MQHLKRCRACGKTLTGNRLYCADAPCQRRANADRKARSRAKARNPEPAPSPQVDAEKGSEGPSGPFLAPWGITYPTEAEAWATAILYDPEIPSAERRRRFDLLMAMSR